MNQTVQTILDAVIAFLSSSVGAALLAMVIKSIVSAVASVKTKKYSKLTEVDKAEIVERVADKVIATIQDGVRIDTDGMIDRATNKRLALLESKNNEFTSTMNNMLEIVKAQGNVLCELKTPSQGARGRLQELIGNCIKEVEYIPLVEQPMLQVKQVEQPSATAEIKEPTVRY